MLRACSILGAATLTWDGDRVPDRYMGTATGIARSKWRLPREERMRAYQDVSWGINPNGINEAIDAGLTPVCVEVLPHAENLVFFEHPEDAIYVFGPEDGSVPKGVRTVCHRFVTIPSVHCTNLAAATNIVLYDRMAKAMVREQAMV